MTFRPNSLAAAYKQYENNKILLQQNIITPLSINDNILLIDGLNMFIRAYCGYPTVTDNGDFVGGLVGFMKSIASCISQFNPTRCIIVFDGKGGSLRRRKLYPQYKEGRHSLNLNRRSDIHLTPEQEQDYMKKQLVRICEYLQYLPITIMMIDYIEADDAIAYIAKDIQDINNRKATIISTDKDYLQLITKNISVWRPTEKQLYNENTVKDRFGVYPCNFIQYKIFIGDSSDNINGVNGIGPKTLIKKFPLLEENKQISYDDILQYANTIIDQNKKSKKTNISAYQKVIESKDIIERNYQLMSLSNNNISESIRLHIHNIFETMPVKMNKFQLKKLFIQDGIYSLMGSSMMDIWLDTNFSVLNSFIVRQEKE